jgi:hypothetical protein
MVGRPSGLAEVEPALDSKAPEPQKDTGSAEPESAITSLASVYRLPPAFAVDKDISHEHRAVDLPDMIFGCDSATFAEELARG